MGAIYFFLYYHDYHSSPDLRLSRKIIYRQILPWQMPLDRAPTKKCWIKLHSEWINRKLRLQLYHLLIKHGETSGDSRRVSVTNRGAPDHRDIKRKRSGRDVGDRDKFLIGKREKANENRWVNQLLRKIIIVDIDLALGDLALLNL